MLIDLIWGYTLVYKHTCYVCMGTQTNNGCETIALFGINAWEKVSKLSFHIETKLEKQIFLKLNHHRVKSRALLFK